MKDSFIFYKEWRDAIADLPNDVRLEIYEAIIEYGTSGKLPVLKPIANVAFNFIKAGIDRNIEKYNDTLNRRKEAGKKGGLAKANNAKQDIANIAKAKNAKHNVANVANANNAKQDVANVAVNDNDNVNDNENKDNTPDGVSKKDAAKAATLKRREEFKKSLYSFVGKYGERMIEAFFSYWGELNKSETKMRFEMQKTWEVGLRLATWAKNEKPKFKTDPGIVLRDNSQSKYDEKLW